MIKIGLTGGIGAGKTFVSRLLIEMGYPVFNSDTAAKDIMLDTTVRSQVESIFGEQAYSNGQLNRPYLANQIFNNSDLKAQLNNIVHPAVRKSFANWAAQQDSPIVFNEAAILFETGSYLQFDYTILVIAPKELRIQRVMSRDNTSEQEVISRMNNQWSDERKINLASYVIVNDEKQTLRPQIERILAELLEDKKN